MRFRTSAAALALLLIAAPAFAQTKVAIANPIKILNALAETQDINKSMESEQTTFKAEAETRKQKVKDMQSQRDQLKPDAPQWADLNKKLVQEQADFNAWGQSTQQDMQRKFRDQAKRMNDKIAAAIKQVATKKQIDLVIADQKNDLTDQQMEGMNPQQIMGVLFGRNVLYSSDTLDLTQEVIATLDAAYKAK